MITMTCLILWMPGGGLAVVPLAVPPDGGGVGGVAGPVHAAAIRAAAARAVRPQAPRIAGPLHTDGSRIIDARGHDVRFTGVDVVGLQSGSGNFVGTGPVGPCGGWRILPPDEFDLIKAWGFNSVRVGISWSDLK